MLSAGEFLSEGICPPRTRVDLKTRNRSGASRGFRRFSARLFIPSNLRRDAIVSNTHWHFGTSASVRFGRGSLAFLPQTLGQLRATRIFIVTDPVVASIEPVRAAIESLKGTDFSVTVFEGGQAEPGVSVAQAAFDAAAKSSIDAVVGIGGGSNLDVAKIVATCLRHGGAIRQYFGFGNIPGPVLPLVAIPTTAGTGSEVSHSAVLTDEDAGVKVSTLSPFLRPAAAIVDPSLTDTCPPRVTAHSGIDALVHAIEALTNKPFTVLEGNNKAYEGSYPLTSLLALEAISHISKSLVRAVENPTDHDARDSMAYAAMLAGMAFSNSGVGLVHALEYPIGAITHCSHGEGNGLLLPHVLSFNRSMCANELAKVASLLLDREDCSSEDAIEAIEILLVRIGIRTRLRDLGLTESDIPTVVSKTLQIERLLAVNARRPTAEDLDKILRRAF